MSNILERTTHVERELASEPLAGPAVGAFVLHLALLLCVTYYGWVLGLFHANVWGNQGAGQAMQVNLVSAAIPLPSNQPLNQNVLTTETPSPAPAAPSPKEQHQVDETAIPIPGKQAKPQPKTTPKTPRHQPPPPQQNVAQYGSQNGTSIPRAAQPSTQTDQPVNVANSDFGSRFAWYVEIIKRRVDQNWYRATVDPHTAKGASVQIYFRVDRQGAPSGFRINTSSGSPTLDRSCLEATQRVDTFGPLPAAANDRWLDVTYNCTY